MSDKFEIEGTLTVIGEIQSFASGFTKRQFVVKTPGEYPQVIAFELVKDSCAKIDKHKLGDGVKVFFNVRGNEYNSKYFVNLSAWKIDSAPDHSVGVRSEEYGKKEDPRRSDKQNGAPPPSSAPADEYQEDDDIPF